MGATFTTAALNLAAEEENDVAKAVSKTEGSTGYCFSYMEKLEILLQTIWKCKCKGKETGYIPILFETELCDYVMRKQINAKTASMMATEV